MIWYDIFWYICWIILSHHLKPCVWQRANTIEVSWGTMFSKSLLRWTLLDTHLRKLQGVKHPACWTRIVFVHCLGDKLDEIKEVGHWFQERMVQFHVLRNVDVFFHSTSGSNYGSCPLDQFESGSTYCKSCSKQICGQLPTPGCFLACVYARSKHAHSITH